MMHLKNNFTILMIFFILLAKIHKLYYDDLENRYIDNAGNMYKNIQDLPIHFI
jgi:hypothetical protein